MEPLSAADVEDTIRDACAILDNMTWILRHDSFQRERCRESWLQRIDTLQKLLTDDNETTQRTGKRKASQRTAPGAPARKLTLVGISGEKWTKAHKYPDDSLPCSPVHD